MRQGVRIGIDVGRARVGVARSDYTGALAVPVETIRREPSEDAIARIHLISAEYEAIEMIVGLPLNLRGESTLSTEDALDFARALSRSSAVPVRVLDERLSTRSASRSLRESGISSKKHRPVIDQQAAVVILQQALDLEKTSGHFPGTSIDTRERPLDE